MERVEELSGGFVRVTFTGDALDDFSWPGAASHLKFFPSPPDTPTGDGALVVPARPASRTYTPRTFDSARGELALDFLIHGEGLGSSWAASATAGDAVRVSVPRASYTTPSQAEWQLLAGDDAAVPALATIIDAGVVVPTLVLVETHSEEDDRPPLPSHPLVSVQWVATDIAAPGVTLLAAVTSWQPPVGTGSIWVACEATAVRSIRRRLLEECGLSPELLVTRGYWRHGAANHPDHDFGADPLDS